MFKKILSVVMVMVLCCCITLPANAQGLSTSSSSVQPRFSYTASVSATLTNSSGKAICGTIVEGYKGITTKIKVTMTFQKKVLLLWTDIQTWSTSVNDYYLSFHKTISHNGGKYRVKSQIVSYSGSASESITKYSSEKEF